MFPNMSDAISKSRKQAGLKALINGLPVRLDSIESMTEKNGGALRKRIVGTITLMLLALKSLDRLTQQMSFATTRWSFYQNHVT